MKKLVILFITIMLLTGCGKSSKDSLVSSFKRDINKTKSYEIDGLMQIINEEDTYEYDLNVKNYNDEYYKISLVNKTNEHEQIILKNKDGVYVKTQESTKQKLNVI